MAPEGSFRNTKRTIWGAFFIALGVLLLLERLQIPGFPSVATWWPLILLVFSFTSLIEGRLGSALTMLVIGAWFFAVTNHWDGLTYGNSWPLVLVAVGLGMVVKALTGEDRRRHRRHLEGGPS